jgi:6-phosphogluconolactonase (cycloisomerase 2 family)
MILVPEVAEVMRQMLRRAPFTLALTFLAACMTGSRSSGTGRDVLYAGVGRELTWYDVNVDDASLERRGAVTLPANVQNVWTHPSRRSLVVAWSDGGPGLPGSHHGVSAFTIDRTSGALTQFGSDVPLPSRAVHLSGNASGTHVLLAHNDPSGVTVIALKRNGELDREVVQPSPVDVGVFAHQVLAAASSDNIVFLVTRGVAPTGTAPERPGAIKEFRFVNGVLSKMGNVAPAGGFGFQARNLDFHPTRPWVYLVLEQQNALQMFELRADHLLSETPRFTASLLDGPPSAGVTQAAGAIAMHPSGKFLYAINRASGQVVHDGARVSAGGSNSVAVFAIDDATGMPTRIANVPTLGSSVRTFGLDSRGRLLAVGNQSPLTVRDGTGVRTIPASIALFRIGDDGRPAFARKYDVETGPQKNLLWVGFVSLP